MSLDNFNEIKQKLIELVIQFETTERKINVLNNTYFLQFFSELEQQRYLQYENDYLVKAIAMKADGKTEEEVRSFLDQCKKEFSSHMQSFYRQHKLALEMENQSKTYTKEDLEKVDQDFKQYCSIYHPLVKAHSNEIERNMYASLITLYRAGNVVGFKNLMKEIQPMFTSPAVEENEKESLVKLYKESILHLKELLAKSKDAFPINKENIFFNDQLLTREEIYLREKNYKAREMNKALQEDFKLQFAFNFSLE